MHPSGTDKTAFGSGMARATARYRIGVLSDNTSCPQVLGGMQNDTPRQRAATRGTRFDPAVGAITVTP